MTGVRSIYATRIKEFSDLAFGGDSAFFHCGHWAAFFRDRMGSIFNGTLIFEIGCSNASNIARIAAKHPATAFIGLDWKCKSIYDGARHISEIGLRNVVLLRARAQDILKIFAPGEIGEVWLFHPDPCDRAVELKNRLINELFLSDLHQVLESDRSILALKTDHPGYYQWVLGLFGIPEPAHFRERSKNDPAVRIRRKDLMSPDDVPIPSTSIQQRFSVAMTSTDFWQDRAALMHTESRLFSNEVTSFEQRFIKKRFPIYYFEIRKKL